MRCVVGAKPRGQCTELVEDENGLINRTAMVCDPYARWCGSCALQAHEIQPPEMAVAVKFSQQLRTESCVVAGNGPCEA
jgi:hypothetical protein